MWLLPRLIVLLAAAITPCLSKKIDLDISKTSQPSAALARPFAWVDPAPDDGLSARVLGMIVNYAEVAWNPGVPEELKTYECFRLYVVTKPDYLLHMDARAVESICKDHTSHDVDQQGPDWAGLFLDFDFFYYIDYEGTKEWYNGGGLIQGWGNEEQHGVLHTPYFVNCCTDLAEAGFKIELIVYTDVNGTQTDPSMGEGELSKTYPVRSFDPKRFSEF